MIFDADELEELRDRAFEASNDAARNLKSALSTAFTDLAVLLDRTHAMLLRETPAVQLLKQLQRRLEAGEENPEAEPAKGQERPAEVASGRELGPLDREAQAMAGEPFAVAPRNRIRTCSVCGERQFHKGSGWVCKNGHGGAPSKEEQGKT